MTLLEKAVHLRNMPKPNKTHRTTVSVDTFIDKHPNEEVRDDSRALVKLMQELTGEEPYMYGPSIIGFGTYHYTYASGHSGTAPLAAFSPRKPEMVIYFSPGLFEQETELVKKLGKVRTSKACLYFKRLVDLDARALRSLLKKSIALAKKT